MLILPVLPFFDKTLLKSKLYRKQIALYNKYVKAHEEAKSISYALSMDHRWTPGCC